MGTPQSSACIHTRQFGASRDPHEMVLLRRANAIYEDNSHKTQRKRLNKDKKN